VSLRDHVESLLGPSGLIATRWARYEDRGAQRELAAAVADTFANGGVLLAEAPTGVGKSLAYLVPALLAARAQNRRVVIATCTKSLQDQLFERDLPAVLESLGWSVPVARLKGKQNYLCPRALETLEGRGEEENDTIEELRRWAQDDEFGDLDRFPATDPEAFRRVRGRVAADPAACSGITCRRGRECFWVRSRRRAAEARILIVNHALLGLSGEAEGLLPDFDLLVVDEAHRLEGVLLSQLERSLSRHRFEETLRLVGARRRGRESGLALRMRGLMMPLFDPEVRLEVEQELDKIAARVEQTQSDLERFFLAVEPQGERHELYGARERYRSASELFGRDLEPLEALHAHCAWFSQSLLRLASRAAAPAERGRTRVVPGDASPLAAAEELAAELERASAQWSVLAQDVEHLGEASDRDFVYWRTASSRGVELHGAPVWVGNHARRLVLGRAEATVLTSATLSTAGDFGFTAERLGLTEPLEYRTLEVESPFPLERQMRAYVHAGAAGDEAREVADIVSALARRTGRNVLALFTAHERLRRVRERLLDQLPRDRVLLAQEWDGNASLVSERFRDARGAVLLGVQSLWEGVDFPGAALEILVVSKLPFSVPDDPLVEARGERLRERGLDPFRHDAVPEAVLRFRQGVGRLIRRADDRGVLVVCDRRLVSASYRRPFLAALPVAPRPFHDPETLAEEAEEFLNVSNEPSDPMPEVLTEEEEV
jgi:Rad3-related DNA helicase